MNIKQYLFIKSISTSLKHIPYKIRIGYRMGKSAVWEVQERRDVAETFLYFQTARGAYSITGLFYCSSEIEMFPL